MVLSECAVFCAVLWLQEAWCVPATTTSDSTTSSSAPSYGTQLSEDFQKNLALMMGNMHNGVVSIATPSIQFGIDTVPSLINHSIHTAADKGTKLADAAHEGFGKVSVGMGHALGGGAVLGSSVAGGGMQVIGHGLGAANRVVGAAAKMGVDIGGRLTGNAAGGTAVTTDLTKTALTMLGDALAAGGGGAGVLAKALSAIIEAMGERIAQGITKTEEAAANLMDKGATRLGTGALNVSAKAQTNFYNALNTFLQILQNVQKLFDSVTASISVGTTEPGKSTAAAASTATTSGSLTKELKVTVL